MSDTPKMDKDRRTWLMATTAVGGCGAAAVAYPFLDSFQPSERAKAAGAAVEVYISGMKPDAKDAWAKCLAWFKQHGVV